MNDVFFVLKRYQTLSTLDYAQRAKKITNKPEVNLKISNKEKIMVGQFSHFFYQSGLDFQLQSDDDKYVH